MAQVFSYEFWEISKNTVFTEHLWATTSGHIFFVSEPKTKFFKYFKRMLWNIEKRLNVKKEK